MSLAIGQVWHTLAINYVCHNLDFVLVSSEKLFESVEPILKWVGGKRSLLSELNEIIPEPALGGTYYEPFLGAGAVLFSRSGNYNLVGFDTNRELIDTYNTIRLHPRKLLELLEVHSENHSKEYFYEVRNWDRLDDWGSRKKIERAARMIFLNKTCFNGMYRVNSSGKFNVPFGNYARPVIADEAKIDAMSKFLKSKLASGETRVSILHGDYSDVRLVAEPGDVVYFDPPYDPLSKSSSFTGYSAKGFDFFDQEKLFILASGLVKNKVKVVISNSDTKQIKDLCIKYGFTWKEVVTSRKLAAKATSRKPIKELVIYPH